MLDRLRPVSATPGVTVDFDLSGLRPARGSVPAVDESAGPPRVLFVCTGNVCRSPLAELVLRSRLSAFDLTATSAGTHALVGHRMPDESIDLAVDRGVARHTAEAHRGAWLTERNIGAADLVLTMDRAQRRHVVELAPAHVRRIFTVREFARLASGVDDAELRPTGSAGPRTALAGAVRAVAACRGAVPPPDDARDDDVIDPFRRPVDVYAESARQLDPALGEVERVIRKALTSPD